MPESLLRSQVRITEPAPRIRSMPQLPTETLAALGITTRGPVRRPITVTSFSEFASIYGFDTEFGLQIRQFFLGGGRTAVISRVVHYTDPADNTTGQATNGTLMLQTGATAPGGATLLGATVGPYRVANLDTLVVHWTDDTGATSATETARVDATAATRVTVNAENYNFSIVGAAPYRLAVRIDGGVLQNIDMVDADFANAAAATAEEVAAAINARLVGARATVTGGGTTVTITSDLIGAASIVDVDAAVGATDANTPLAFPLAAGTGTGQFTRVADAANLGAIQNAAAVTVAELVTALTALPTAADIAAQGDLTIANDGNRVRITTDSTGVAARLAVSDASVNLETLLGFAATAAAGGIDLVTPEANVATGTSGAAVNTLQILGKYPGAYSGDVQIEIVNATSGLAAEFDLLVYEDDLLVDRFRNLTMDSAAARYVEGILGVDDDPSVGESQTVRAADQDAAGTPAQRRPANTALMPAAPSLTAGNNGLVGLVDADFSGDSAGLTGLNAFDTTEGLRLIICPDRTTAAFQNAMTAYAASRGFEIFAILDPPAGNDRAAIVAYVATLTATEFGALYWPRVRVPTPSAAFSTATLVATGVSGFIAGAMARNSANNRAGPFVQPANPDFGQLVGAVALETDDHEVLTEGTRDVVFPLRINPIMQQAGRGVFADGARTLLATGNFPSVGERRGVSDIEAVLRRGLDLFRNRNNTVELRQEADRSVRAYLLGRARDGAFASRDPAVAFFVDFSEALNPPSVTRAGQLRGRVGLATAAPAEFVLLEVSQDLRALEEELNAP